MEWSYWFLRQLHSWLIPKPLLSGGTACSFSYTIARALSEFWWPSLPLAWWRPTGTSHCCQSQGAAPSFLTLLYPCTCYALHVSRWLVPSTSFLDPDLPKTCHMLGVVGKKKGKAKYIYLLLLRFLWWRPVRDGGKISTNDYYIGKAAVRTRETDT